jgi:hypothetical protein
LRLPAPKSGSQIVWMPPTWKSESQVAMPKPMKARTQIGTRCAHEEGL